MAPRSSRQTCMLASQESASRAPQQRQCTATTAYDRPCGNRACWSCGGRSRGAEAIRAMQLTLNLVWVRIHSLSDLLACSPGTEKTSPFTVKLRPWCGSAGILPKPVAQGPPKLVVRAGDHVGWAMRRHRITLRVSASGLTHSLLANSPACHPSCRYVKPSRQATCQSPRHCTGPAHCIGEP